MEIIYNHMEDGFSRIHSGFSGNSPVPESFEAYWTIRDGKTLVRVGRCAVKVAHDGCSLVVNGYFIF
jgi:hypothetical protein